MKKMKFCPHCGFPLSDCFKFCPECGKTLEEENGQAENTSWSTGTNTDASPSTSQMIPAKADNNNSTIKKPVSHAENSNREYNDDSAVYTDLVPPYIKSQLIFGEKVIHVCRIHWKIWLPAIFWFAVMSGIAYPLLKSPGSEYFNYVMIPLFLIFLWYFTDAMIEHICTCLAVTNKRVICKFGFIRRSTFEINLDKVEGVNLEQSFWGRIFDCSTVIVRGTGSSHAPVPNIINAKEFKQALLSESEKYKNRRK